MRNITNGASISGFCVAGSPSFGLSTITLPLETPLRTMVPSINGTVGSLSYATANNNYTSGDLASVDSSDTYASCQTHPFLSQADLNLSDFDLDDNGLDDLDMNNLYINPLEKDGGNVEPRRRRSQVKKSASGDMALRSLADASPMDENGAVGGGANTASNSNVYHHYPTFEQRERGSRGSLNETTTPVPKHRKTRYQQSSATTAAVAAAAAAAIASKPKARFDIGACGKQSLESLSGGGASATATVEAKKKTGTSRSSFMPAKSLASATKLINQHLFGIQSIGSRGERDVWFFF